jgi:hypothetical protein
MIIWSDNLTRLVYSLVASVLLLVFCSSAAIFLIPRYILPWIYVENYGESYRESQKIIPGQEVDISIRIRLDQKKALEKCFLKNIKRLCVFNGRFNINEVLILYSPVIVSIDLRRGVKNAKSD